MISHNFSSLKPIKASFSQHFAACSFKSAGAQVASKTNDVAGDGTTTATVLARAIFREGCKAEVELVGGLFPWEFSRKNLGKMWVFFFEISRGNSVCVWNI